MPSPGARQWLVVTGLVLVLKTRLDDLALDGSVRAAWSHRVTDSDSLLRKVSPRLVRAVGANLRGIREHTTLVRQGTAKHEVAERRLA